MEYEYTCRKNRTLLMMVSTILLIVGLMIYTVVISEYQSSHEMTGVKKESHISEESKNDH